MIQKIKAGCFYIICGIIGFWTITTTAVTGAWIQKEYFPTKEQRDTVVLKLDPSVLIEYVAQSSYEFRTDGNVCSLALKSHK